MVKLPKPSGVQRLRERYKEIKDSLKPSPELIEIMSTDSSKVEVQVMAEIMQVVNEVGTTRKTKRAVLRHKYGCAEAFIDELLPMDKEYEDY